MLITIGTLRLNTDHIIEIDERPGYGGDIILDVLFDVVSITDDVSDNGRTTTGEAREISVEGEEAKQLKNIWDRIARRDMVALLQETGAAPEEITAAWSGKR